MKKLTLIVLCIALIASLMLVSCGEKKQNGKQDDTAAEVTDTVKADDTAEADDTAKADDTTKADDTDDTAADDTTSAEPEKITVKSEEEIKDINQMKDYDIDHADLSAVKAGNGGDVKGIWLSDIQQYATDMDNNPDTTEYLSYRMAFSFHGDGTGLIYLYMGPVEFPFTYTVDGGNIVIKADGVKMDNAKFTVSDDGQYLVFTSDQLSTNFMKIG